MVTLFFFFYSNFVLDLPKENDMTKEEILELARQAGFVDYELDDGTTDGFDKRYETFAKLIAQHERKNFCAQLAQLHDSYSLASHTTTLRGQK